ncbi:exodeoxyribonuclease V subunit beta [Halorhodospira halophila]|uniref:RecBCD enzyme subunit RecB n=1 Tax=Halorhodospira halophila (strain DSM 244 / SL1) TaxID=349124 RepID=A1WWI3_HALHL|nr:exodeoxyribonuclease V subunit beta [Halorhodospira halophila]ABM62045.1 DNA helicase/exodeoxyribonuclease V, beta subunit [Halorhodospira halophila SL1]MBK1728414.1 exodeoxyribonuclease V subunit beta [Halorhodospira halophila]
MGTAEDAKPLEPLRFPLYGSRLIEASAGTGKTYTIAALYLRLVLNHGREAAYGQSLTPPQILVVTFTEAATRELRERIRSRLAEAAAAFRDPDQAVELDPFLDGLLREYPQRAERAQAARVLELAAEWMDEAAVATIHAWCYRMLREHAFDSGSLFTQDLETDPGELLAESVRDYWRTFVYPLDPEAFQLFRQAVGAADPDALQRALARLIGADEELADDADDPLLEPSGLAERLGAWHQALEQLKAPWRDEREAVEAEFLDLHRRVLNGTKYKNPQQLLERMAAWADDPAQPVPLTDKGKPDPGLLERMSATGLADPSRHKKGQSLPASLHRAFKALDRHVELDAPGVAILRAAARWITRRFQAEQRRRAQLGFQDLLTRLRDALRGPGGARLAQTIRSQFPVALIDEFQDTDPVQYELFETVYRIADNDPGLGLFLIGDPKQAIYGFRGADIHSYLRARAATEGRHYTLPRNFRSSEALVGAVNQLFARAEGSWPAGAFAFRGGSGGGLPFHPVEAQGRGEFFEEAGAEHPALNLWCHDPGVSVAKNAYLPTYAEACAARIVALLNGGAARPAVTGFRHPGGHLEPVRPRDMAVLVRNHTEASAIQEALAAREVRSVYLSDRDSVLATAEADDLVRWLRACAEPTDEGLVRAALATPTLGLALSELDRLVTDELAWERRIEQFGEYRRLWRSRGVLAMLHRLLHDFGVPQRLLAISGGERSLTNLLHLAELLQQWAREHDGEQALIRHLVELRQQARNGVEDQILRLESDEDLVKVVTIHKSKGLQYPLVFLPFVCTFRPVTARDAPRRVPDQHGRLRWRFELDQEDVEAADSERLAEDLRLFYVALTRAQHACWVGMAPITQGNTKRSLLERSAAGYLLAGPDGVEPGGLGAVLEQAAAADPAITVSEPLLDEASRFVGDPAAPPLGEPCQPRRRAADAWWIASYSALVRHDTAGRARSAPASAAEDVLREESGHALVQEAGGDAGSWHGFPRGPDAGTFLHNLLEWAATQLGLATAGAQPEWLDAEVERRCRFRGWDGQVATVQGWLRALLGAELSLPGAQTTLALGRLPTYQAELEFLIETQPLRADRLDDLVCQHLLPGRARPPVAPARLNGMLKGFIDLVCCHEGRYYVADYKSNWLGGGDGHYAPEYLEAEVLERRYDLQLVIYTLALHRLLRARMPDYDYDRHVGGGFYLFLRGVQAPGQGVFHARPPRALIEELDGWLRDGPDGPQEQTL